MRLRAPLVALAKAQAVQAPQVAEAVRLLAQWDGRASAESRGAVLFDRWLVHYSLQVPSV